MLEQGEWGTSTDESSSDLMLVVPHSQTQQETNYSIALPSSSNQLALPPSTSQETQNDVEMAVAVSNAVQVVEGKIHIVLSLYNRVNQFLKYRRRSKSYSCTCFASYAATSCCLSWIRSRSFSECVLAKLCVFGTL